MACRKFHAPRDSNVEVLLGCLISLGPTDVWRYGLDK